MAGSIILRPYRPGDGPLLAALFYQTVHTVNARDYTPAQLEVWAPSPGAPSPDGSAAWERSFQGRRALVAEIGGQIAGFGDLDPESGYLDRLYVHKDRQGQGVASALCAALEAASRAGKVYTYASLTARPFFLRRGYRVLRENQVERRGVALTNFLMEKRLSGAL